MRIENRLYTNNGQYTFSFLPARQSDNTQTNHKGGQDKKPKKPFKIACYKTWQT